MQIYVTKDGEQYGPFDEAEISEQLKSGRFNSTDLAWREGIPEWIPISNLTPSKALPAGMPPLPSQNRVNAGSARKFTDAEILEIAKEQKAVIWIIVASLVTVFFPLAAIATGILSSVFIYRFARAVGSSVAWLYGLFGLVPLLGILGLLTINSRAMAALTGRGLRVGFFGVDTNELAQLAAQGSGEKKPPTAVARTTGIALIAVVAGCLVLIGIVAFMLSTNDNQVGVNNGSTPSVNDPPKIAPSPAESPSTGHGSTPSANDLPTIAPPPAESPTTAYGFTPSVNDPRHATPNDASSKFNHTVGEKVSFDDSDWIVLDARDIGSVLPAGAFTESKRSEGKFVYVRFKVTNKTLKQEAVLFTPAILDEKGRRFEEMDSTLLYLPDGEVSMTMEALPPGLPKTFSSIFEVPTDASGLVFLTRNFSILDKIEKGVNLGFLTD